MKRCAFCSKKFKSYGELLNHFESVHRNNEMKKLNELDNEIKELKKLTKYYDSAIKESQNHILNLRNALHGYHDVWDLLTPAYVMFFLFVGVVWFLSMAGLLSPPFWLSILFYMLFISILFIWDASKGMKKN